MGLTSVIRPGSPGLTSSAHRMKTKCGAYHRRHHAHGTHARARRRAVSGHRRPGSQIVEDGGITHVTIEADGPLPLPLSESLNNPPRISFDLPGVTHKLQATTAAQRGGLVSRVRVALRPRAARRSHEWCSTSPDSKATAPALMRSKRDKSAFASAPNPQSIGSLRDARRFRHRLRLCQQTPHPHRLHPLPGSLCRRHPPRPPATPRRRWWKAPAPPRRRRLPRSPSLRLVEVLCCLQRRRDCRSRHRRSRFIANRYIASLHGWRRCECSSPESIRARASVPTLWR